MMDIETVGNDGFSDIVRTTFPNGAMMFSRVTNCCGASAKGVEYGTHVACRACRNSVEPEFGMAWMSDNEFDIKDLIGLLGVTREVLLGI